MKIRNNLFLLIFALLAFHAQAEILKWVDEKGQVHYGDKVPEQYQQQADTVDVDDSNFIKNENQAANQQQFDKMHAEDEAEKANAPADYYYEPPQSTNDENTSSDNSRTLNCINPPNQAMEIRCRKR